MKTIYSTNNLIFATLLVAILSFNCNRLNAQAVKNYTAFINCIAHIGNGEVVDPAIISVKGNKIESVQNAKGIKLNYTAFDTVIDLEGKHVYPTLINANNVLGLHDAFSVRATRDLNDVGNINPHIRALIAYNSDNKITPTIKTNGILYTQVTPRGGMVSGNSSIMALEGWNWEDAVLLEDDGIHINFPVLSERVQNEEGGEDKAKKRYEEDLTTLNNFFSDAIAYYNNANITEKNIRLESMKGVFAGTKNLYIHTDRAKDILTALYFIKKHEIKKPVLVGAKECYKVLKEIKNANVPVMLVRVHDLPERTDDDIDAVYNLPAILQKENIMYCLQTAGDSEMEAMNSRNLPFLAGSAVAYGLTQEQAISAITLNVAKIIGADKLIGSLEDNKLASFVVSTGDILDMKSSNIVQAYIGGKPVNLNNQQTELYIKYKNKYGIK